MLHLRTIPLKGELSPVSNVMKRKFCTLKPTVNIQQASVTICTLPQLLVSLISQQAQNDQGDG